MKNTEYKESLNTYLRKMEELSIRFQAKYLVYKSLYNAIIYYMDIISQLEEYRLENRISQEKLAEILGVHFTTINRWLNKHQKPNKMQEYHVKKLLKRKKVKR